MSKKPVMYRYGGRSPLCSARAAAAAAAGLRASEVKVKSARKEGKEQLKLLLLRRTWQGSQTVQYIV
jgi:hypothetical protein